MTTENWQTRRCARDFTDEEVDFRLIHDIINIIPAIPAQNGYVDHWWVVFGPKDYKYKQWLVENIYHAVEKVKEKEYFTGLMTAPYLFHSFKIYPTMSVANEPARNNAFHAGVIVSQAVDKGLDAAPIACREGWEARDGKLKQQYQKMIWQRFKPAFLKISHTHKNEVYRFNPDTIRSPMMSVGIGHGKPVLSPGVVKTYKDGISVLGKPQKAMENVSIWNLYE